MKSTLLFLYFLVNIISLNGQIKTYPNSVFAGNSFDAFAIKIDSAMVNEFKVNKNGKQLKNDEYVHKELAIDSLCFFINASITDSLCNPIGLFIDNYIEKRPINLKTDSGNFYLKPNGAILFTETDVIICESSKISNYQKVRLGLQSGPMLVENRVINQQFNKKSSNKNVRCGVGIYIDESNDRWLLFCISNEPVTFYEMALVFDKKYKCSDALCLESLGCMMYFPERSILSDLYQGVICNYLYYKL